MIYFENSVIFAPRNLGSRTQEVGYLSLSLFLIQHGPVAQLNRVADYGSAGWGFESLQGHLKSSEYIDFTGVSENDRRKTDNFFDNN